MNQLPTQPDQAIEMYRQLVRAQPESVEHRIQLGRLLETSGDFAAAIDVWRELVELEPDCFPALCALGISLGRTGDVDGSIAAFRKALAINGEQFQVHVNLAVSLQKKGELDEAVALYQRAIQLKPDSAQLYCNLAVALAAKGDLDQAIAACRTAISLQPTLAMAHYNLATALTAKEELDEALTACRRAIELKPDYAEAYNNLSVILRKKGDWDGSAAACGRALELKPDYAEALNNLGVVHEERCQWQQAIALCRKATELEPNLASAHWNLAILLLKLGQYEEGWKEYEWRLEVWPERRKAFPLPEWRGQPIPGKTLLLHAEQGFGDSIQFVRYIPRVIGSGGHVVLLCPTELHKLFAESFGRLCEVTDRMPSSYDLHCPLPSLPGIFRTRVESIPVDVPYLYAPPALVDVWAKRLDSPKGRLRVGLTWAGNPSHLRDAQRSIPFDMLSPLATLPIEWHSLQVGTRAGDVSSSGLSIADHSHELSDFVDTAALIEQLDLVITVDTAVAHLAGALGKRVWVMLPWSADWRWMLERDDSPWYPTMRLFRQQSPGDWPGTMQRIADALRDLATNRATQRGLQL